MKLYPLRSICLAALLAVPLLTGCKAHQTHDDNVNAANERHRQFRTAVFYDMAMSQFNTGDLNQAEESINDALAMDPEDHRLYTLGGRVSLERGRLEHAWLLFERAISLNNRDYEAHYYAAVVQQRWQQPTKAYNTYLMAYHLRPDHAPYLLAAIEMLVEMDRTDKAIRMLEEKRTYFDQNASVRATLAQLYQLKGDLEEAANYFRQAAVLDPDSLKMQEDHASVLLSLGDWNQASRILERLLSEDEYEDRLDIKRRLAHAYVQMDELRQARQLYSEITRARGSDVDDWVKAGELAWRDGDTGSALTFANRVINLAPRRHEGYMLAGMVWQHRGRLEQALEMFDRAAYLAPEQAEPWILRGLSLQREGNLAAAATAYEEALERQPNDRRAQRLLNSVASQLR